jgi:hypothetical protein
MLTFIAALIPLYFVWSIIQQIAGADDGAELLGSLLGLGLVIWVFSILLG